MISCVLKFAFLFIPSKHSIYRLEMLDPPSPGKRPPTLQTYVSPPIPLVSPPWPYGWGKMYPFWNMWISILGQPVYSLLDSSGVLFGAFLFWKVFLEVQRKICYNQPFKCSIYNVFLLLLCNFSNTKVIINVSHLIL